MKVSVLVYKGNLSLRGWSTLVQSDLQYLKLHVNKRQAEELRSERWRDDKKRDLAVFLTSGFRQCPEGRDVCEHVCVWPEPAGSGTVSGSCGVLAESATLTNTEYC